MQERIVVISDGSTPVPEEVAAVAAEAEASTGALEVVHVLPEAEVPSDPAGRTARIGAERARLDGEVDRLARRFPLLRVASRVLVDDPAAVRRGMERRGARVLAVLRVRV